MTSSFARLTVVLYEPRIPQNTGNIARTCAAFNIPLVLIEPLGFSLESKFLKRAGLDYWPLVNVSTFPNFSEYRKTIHPSQRIIAASSRDGCSLSRTKFQSGDILLFGREDNGLPDSIKTKCAFITTINMPGKQQSDGQPGVRSLNLSVSCAIVCFQAGSQLKYW